MGNLDAEQIKKALECWVEKYKSKYYTNHAKDALALINSQKQRIKELTEERDGFEILAHTAIETQNRMSDTIDELTEENERLSQSLANISQSLANSKADTVREMQERLKEKLFSVPTVYNSYFGRMIDQIAKEMLEEGGNKND
jgi:methyl-accepting chemotaxis protein